MQFDNVEDVYAPSPIQEGMLFHTISEPGSGVFVEQISCTIRGKLQTQYYRDAWAAVVKRHAALRTIFLWDGLDEPLQVVRESVDIPWAEHDSRAQPAEQQHRKFDEFLRTDRIAGFDLSQAPLMRMSLFRLSDQTTRFVWTFHHLLSDGWSTPLVLQEVFQNYICLAKHQSVRTNTAFAYKDFIAHLQTQSMSAAEAFWRDRLSGFNTSTRIHDHTQKVVAETACHRQKRTLSAQLSTQLKSFAKQHRLTLNSVVLGAWSLLLKTHSRETDVVFGATVSGRPPELAGVESAVGLFINTLPLRIQVSDQPLIAWLREIQQQQISMRQFEYSPLASVQRWSDIPRGEALFESIVVFENYPESIQDDLDTVGISVAEFDYIEQSNYPLALLVVPHDNIELYLVHQLSRFSDAFVCSMLEQVEHLLGAFLATPQAKLSHLSLLSESDQAQLLVDSQGDRLEIESATILELFDQQVTRKPNEFAVVGSDVSLTYRDLDQRAKAVQKSLLDNGLNGNQLVGLFVERSADMIASILGILKAGCAYVPLDPDYPAARLQAIGSDATLAAIVTTRHLAESIPKCNASTIVIDNSSLPEGSFPDTATNIHEHRHAYVIYTSGSEGQPKGIPVSHRNLVSSTLARRHFYQEPVRRFLLLSSFSFDSSVVGIFWTLIDGGTLVLPPPKLEQDLERLADLIFHEHVTHLLCLPSLYALLLQYVDSQQLESLDTVIVAGEACTNEVVRQHHACLSSTKLHNEYGPTEATVWCVATELTPHHENGPVPIGRPIANTQVYVVDEHQRLVPNGVCGELCVAGVGLTNGYLNRDKLTNERFVNNPFAVQDVPSKMYRTGDLVYALPSGDLVFAGRIDQQVKIRGYRIELGEIENAIQQHPAVKETVVIARDFDASSTDSGAEPKLDEIEAMLLSKGPTEANRILDDLLSIPESEVERQLAEEFE